PTPPSTLFPYTTLFRSHIATDQRGVHRQLAFPIRAVTGRALRCVKQLASAGRSGSSRQSLPIRADVHIAGADLQWRRSPAQVVRSEEHTSELQSRFDLV